MSMGPHDRPLEEYRKKRDFSRTPEPGPKVGSGDSGNHFVIHKHASRRLHYDVRLELDGVLLSWAVPKGPSLDPADKHLAVHVEDHPLEYAGFEGTIPKGEYGGGTVMIWDEGTWEPIGDSAADPRTAYAEGKLKFRLNGRKLHGGWMLVRLRKRPEDDDKAENWLLFKERDEEARTGDEARITVYEQQSAATGRSMEQIAAEADRVWRSEGDQPGEQPPEVIDRLREQASAGATSTPRAAAPRLHMDLGQVEGARKGPLPERLEPQLATLVTEAPAGEDWLHEIKLDGYRVLCRIEDGRARFFTRRGANWTSHFPTLVEPIGRIPARQALLDGEVVYVKEDGRTSFLRLAGALQSGTDPEGRIVFYAFDLLHLDGYDLTRSPLRARKQALRQLLSGFEPSARVRYVEHIDGRGAEVFRRSCELALEGVIAKRREAPYRSGRGRDWLKVKCMHRQEFVIGGFTERADHRGGIGALLMGYHETPGGPLLYAGRVGTGWDERTMKDLRSRLDLLPQPDPPFENPPRGRETRGVTWVRPDLVAEIEYLSWTGAGMLRHPSFEGLRLDKPPADVVPERAQPQPLQPLAPAHDTAATARADEESAAPVKSAGTKQSGAAAERRAAGGPSRDSRARKSPAPRRRGRGAAGETVEVGGVLISNPQRVMYPESGITKLEVARYYEELGDWILPHLSRRPLTLVRCPEGYTKECFFQKHATESFPESILRVPVKENGGSGTYLAVDSVDGLLSLVQMGVLEFHVWGSRLDTLEQPDQICFDLDPDAGLPFSRVVDAARLMRTLLEGLGLQSFVKTTGGKGLHVVAPIRPTRGWDEVKAFTKALAEAVVEASPDRYVSTMSLKKRAGKTFIDYLRNGRGATYVTAYSTRRRPGAPVSTPLRWQELGPQLDPRRYSLENMRRRLANLKSDPWEGFADVAQEITPAMERATGVGRRRRRDEAA